MKIYTRMTPSGYISVAAEFRAYKTQLSPDQLLLLARFMFKSSLTAYGLFDNLRKERRPISYKNVHKRVQRLYVLGLIQKIRNRQWMHGAVHFRLTTQGIYYLFLNYFRIAHWFISDVHSLFKHYSNDKLLAEFLYPYVKLETINQLHNIHFFSDIFNYLHDCCILVNQTLNRLHGESFAQSDITTDHTTESILLEYRTNSLISSLIIEVFHSQKVSMLSHKERIVLIQDDHFVKVAGDVYHKFRQAYEKLQRAKPS